MGKLLDKYKAEYEAAITPGLKDGKSYVVKPEVWIYLKWESDNSVAPWDPVKLQAALKDAVLKDPEFGQILIAGMGEFLGGIRKADLG